MTTNTPCAIYVYPPDDGSMPYVRTHTRLWCAMGYAVRGLSIRELAPWVSGRARRVAILNWFEDWMLQNSRPGWIKVTWALFVLLACRLSCGHMIWVRHNFVPHDDRAKSRLRRVLIWALAMLSDEQVAHRPIPGVQTTVVPHPLVASLPQGPAAPRPCDFVWFGAVRRYKALRRLLREWPADKALTLAGACDCDDLEAELREIIRSRRLQVQWENRALTDSELDQLLEQARFALIAHDDNTMIVSGTFYLAAAKGVNVLARDSGFTRHIAAKHSFVSAYRDGGLSQRILGLEYVEPEEVCRQAMESYGDDVVTNAWARVLTRGAPEGQHRPSADVP